MQTRNILTFNTSIADEPLFTDEEGRERPGGDKIATVIAEILKKKGYMTSKLEQHSFYGWEFSVWNKDVTVWFVLQFPGPWLLLSQNKSNFLKKLFSISSEQHTQILKTLNVCLVQDGRFQNMQWYSRGEYESGKGVAPGYSTP